MNGVRLTDEQIDAAIVWAHTAGWTVDRICRELGVPPHRVRKVLKRDVAL